MRVLILEDDHNRQRVFIKNLISADVSIVETARDAIEQLSSNTWDWLFLDHDLGGQQMVESGPGTGYEVAEWLAKNPEQKPPNVIIHSFNPCGSENMSAIIPGSIRAPGCWSSLSAGLEPPVGCD